MVRFPVVPDGEAVVVSATTYTTYLQCPARAVARLQGAYPADTTATLRGGLAHRLFARHLRSGEIPEDRFEQVCREEIGGGLNPTMGALRPTMTDLRGVMREVGDLYQRFKRISTDGFDGAEVPVEAEPQPGLTLRGTVDAVFDDPEHGVRLVDWKTGGLWAADDQLGFYALVWALERGAPPGYVEAVSVSTGERTGYVPSESGLDRIAHRVAELVEVARSCFAGGSADAIGGPWCRHCPVLEQCAEGRSAAAVASA